MPFPHCLSVVIRDLQSNSLQMLTQGTADIILDCCDDFWDGHDLRPLGPAEKKRAQDFYQRNALTSYCTAFAYRPLRHGVSGALSETAYMELPPESVYKTNAQREHDRGGIFCTFDAAHSEQKTTVNDLKHAISSDSLLFSDNKEDDVCDVDGCFDMQCHQIFIGMVTMQYQAQTDIVSMIERLERACIRFVHFSKENELRSRVFSEKMGLESGWNCHISLLSDESSGTVSPKKQPRPFETEITSSSHGAIYADDEDIATELNRLLPPTRFVSKICADKNLFDLEKFSFCFDCSTLESTKPLSSSAPGAIHEPVAKSKPLLNHSLNSSTESVHSNEQRISKDSAMEDENENDNENCQSLSGYTDSSDQSAAVNFDMSNRV